MTPAEMDEKAAREYGDTDEVVDHRGGPRRAAELGFFAGIAYRDQNPSEYVKALERVVKVAKGVMDSCLCRRFKTPGCDYNEEHKYLGKAKIGARWLTPRDALGLPLSELEKLKGGRDV